jgi:hypothetical protein
MEKMLEGMDKLLEQTEKKELKEVTLTDESSVFFLF